MSLIYSTTHKVRTKRVHQEKCAKKMRLFEKNAQHSTTMKSLVDHGRVSPPEAMAQEILLEKRPPRL
jgi:hypothetical protein